MKKEDIQINKIVRKMLRKFFKESRSFYSMNNTSGWDSLNHLRLVLIIQKKFSVKFSNSEISKITDQKKIVSFIIKKLK